MLWGRLVTEFYFRAWMSLHPTYLMKLLIHLIVMGVVVLTPLIAMNWHLAGRGI
ncbi:MAG: hypothetical protein RLZ25_9 [Pseudomonadota bacterium]|jgi:hypothetical protein